MTKELCESDGEIAADPAFRDIFLEEQQEAFRQGSRGVTTDAAVHYVDWGFRLKEVPCRVHVFHGTEDCLPDRIWQEPCGTYPWLQTARS